MFKEINNGLATIIGSLIGGGLYLLIVWLTPLQFSWFGPIGTLLSNL